MLVLRYRASTNKSLVQVDTNCFDTTYSLMMALGVGAVVMGICMLVMALIAEPRDFFEGYELHAGVLTVIGIAWVLALEGIKQHRNLRRSKQQSSARKLPSISEKVESETFPGSRTPSARSIQVSRPPSRRSVERPPTTMKSEIVEEEPVDRH